MGGAHGSKESSWPGRAASNKGSPVPCVLHHPTAVLPSHLLNPPCGPLSPSHTGRWWEEQITGPFFRVLAMEWRAPWCTPRMVLEPTHQFETANPELFQFCLAAEGGEATGRFWAILIVFRMFPIH